MIKQYIKRIIGLGPANTVKAIEKRLIKRFFIIRFNKNKALAKQANHTWKQVSIKLKTNDNFSSFLKKLKQQNIFELKATQDCDEILGQQYCFKNETNWQKDFKTTKFAKTWGNKLLFFTDIKIDSQTNKLSLQILPCLLRKLLPRFVILNLFQDPCQHQTSFFFSFYHIKKIDGSQVAIQYKTIENPTLSSINKQTQAKKLLINILAWILKQVQDDKCTPNKMAAKSFNFMVRPTSSLNSLSLFDYNPDIKVPWEISRFQHLYCLGQNYQSSRNEKRAKEFQTQVEDWIKKNPFLLGANWVCPMDVAIRAINFIHAFHFFKSSKTITLEFWSTFTCSLYDHMIYLENNWEESDKPNNHYLSDLIGYLYLTFFFSDLKNIKKKQKRCIKKLLRQFDHQVQDDGTSYEGSTSYHKLVTEIFWHFKLLCEKNNVKLPEKFYAKLNKMFEFVQDCTDCAGNFVQIGDNDSGRILCGVRRPLSFDGVYSHYPNFGLTIINNNCWHITFRHPTFNKKQPTGHFHQDELSVTFSIDGIPILVDPGTYLYTANSFARNYFRSYQGHNTFYLKQESKFNDLFQLPRKEQADTAKQEKQIIVSNHTQNNQRRKIIFDSEKEVLEIQDFIETNPSIHFASQNTQGERRYAWNFIFHPNLKLDKRKNNCWIIKKDKKEIMQMNSDIFLEKTQGFYSDRYGKIETCEKLTGENKNHLTQATTIFKKLNNTAQT